MIATECRRGDSCSADIQSGGNNIFGKRNMIDGVDHEVGFKGDMVILGNV